MMTRFLVAVAILLFGSCGAVKAQSVCYAFDLFGDDRLIQFPVDDPASNVTEILPMADYLTFAMDFDLAEEVIHAIDRFDFVNNSSNPRQVGTIDPGTGSFTATADLGGDFIGTDFETGLSFDPTDGTLYLSSSNGSTSTLYTLDPSTGSASLIGEMDDDGSPLMAVQDIAINASGQMYAHDVATDALYAIDKTSGAAMLIGTHGLAANFAQGMDFDPVTDELYAAIYTGSGTGSFCIFDLATGTCSQVEDFTNFTNAIELEMTIISAPGDVVPYPTEFEAFRGFIESGDLAALQESDDVDLCHRPGITVFPSEAPVTLDFFGNVPTDSPANLSCTIESSANTTGLELTVLFWNYNTGDFDVVGVGGQTNNIDMARTFTGVPADHVESGTAAVQCRYEVRQASFVLLFPWTDCIDQVIWSTK